MRPGRTPTSLSHRRAASSSSVYTLTHSLSGSRPIALGEKLPGEHHRLFLEIVAEAEVAQHLEEGVVARGAAHVFQVVVLAADPEAFLAGGGPAIRPLFLAGEDVLELDHARVGEQQAGVVGGHHAGAFHHLVPLFDESSPEIAGGSRCRSWPWLTSRSLIRRGATGPGFPARLRRGQKPQLGLEPGGLLLR